MSAIPYPYGVLGAFVFYLVLLCYTQTVAEDDKVLKRVELGLATLVAGIASLAWFLTVPLFVAWIALGVTTELTRKARGRKKGIGNDDNEKEETS